MASTRWEDLGPGRRRAVLFAAGLETGLKVAALIDLAPRPREEIRGPKAAWAAAIVLTGSAGLVPLAYFLRGRVDPPPPPSRPLPLPPEAEGR
ncbi:hypothetical protein GCM10023200_25520 [Actinomycetospora chlora]|uniref:Uncharacterized protein n=1 Tax=Actinomycetospora chlora TaxID=663608 RepID=A0ABP9B420_9PSEU